MSANGNLKGHLCMALACIMWGLMAPIGKDAMTHGLNGIEMVTFRAVGGAICFWITSLFVERETVSARDMVRFFFAAMLSIVFNQCCYTIGLSITSPVNASIMTTTMPIVTMILAALILREPVTGKKVGGIVCGAVGASLLITASASPSADGNLLGDMLCLAAQCSFALYLTLFKHLISRYSVFTCMKWMMTYAAIVILPFSFSDLSALSWSSVPLSSWFEAGFVVLCGTFIAYICMMIGQKNLRPTVVSMYNYVQPIVACGVSVILGLGKFGLLQGAAIALVFSGVYLVTQSKSRRDVKIEQRAERNRNK